MLLCNSSMLTPSALLEPPHHILKVAISKYYIRHPTEERKKIPHEVMAH